MQTPNFTSANSAFLRSFASFSVTRTIFDYYIWDIREILYVHSSIM